MEGVPVNDSEVVPDVVIERDGDAEGEKDPNVQRGGACCSSHTPESQSLSNVQTALRTPASSRSRNADDESNIRRRRGRI